MAEVDRYLFSHKEVVTALIKEQGIHEGIWGLFIEFGLGAANMGPSEDQLYPTAIVPVQKVGVMRGEKLSALTVDAAEVNPLT